MIPYESQYISKFLFLISILTYQLNKMALLPLQKDDCDHNITFGESVFIYLSVFEQDEI